LEQPDPGANEPEEEIERRRAAAVSDIAELQGAFEIPDDDWCKLVELAASLGTVSPDRWLDLLGRLATYRMMMMSPRHRENKLARNPAKTKRAAKIAALCESLLEEINSPAPEAGPLERHKIEKGFQYLEELRDRARIAAIPTKPPPHNVDIRRDIVWERLIEIFEASTCRPARVSIAAIGSNAGNGYGKIVDFIQAFTATIPGSPVPTAHQIRAFEKKCRDTRRMASRLPVSV
jgi:hypothetical protein